MGERDIINHHADKQIPQHIPHYIFWYSFTSANNIKTKEKVSFYQKLLNFIKLL